jgi:hypothetical protein
VGERFARIGLAKVLLDFCQEAEPFDRILKRAVVYLNGERPNQSLGHKTPDVVSRTATEGVGVIVDKLAAWSRPLRYTPREFLTAKGKIRSSK